MRKNSLIIPNSIYPLNIYVFYGDAEKAKIFFKEHSIDVECIDKYISDKYAARTVRTEESSILIHLTELSVGMIVHECFHAVEFVFDHIGLDLKKHSSEAWAYYLEYLVTEISNNIKDTEF